MRDGGNDSGRAVGGCGHHSAAGGVLLVDRHGENIDPINGAQRIGGALNTQLPRQLRRAAPDIESAGQDAFGFQSAGDAFLHDLPDAMDVREDFLFAVPGLFVLEHHLPEREAVLVSEFEQTRRALEGIRRLREPGVGRSLVTFTGDEAASDGVEDIRPAHRAGGVGRAETHGVGVTGEDLVSQKQKIGAGVERNIPETKKLDPPGLDDLPDLRINRSQVGFVGCFSIRPSRMARSVACPRPVRAREP